MAEAFCGHLAAVPELAPLRKIRLNPVLNGRLYSL